MNYEGVRVYQRDPKFEQSEREKNTAFNMLMGWYFGYFGLASAHEKHHILMDKCHTLVDSGMSGSDAFFIVTRIFMVGLEANDKGQDP